LIEGQEVSIAINKVVLTKGGLRGVEAGTITLETLQQLKLNWKYAPEDAGQHPDDQLYVALYVPSLAKQQLWVEVAKRTDKQAVIVLDPQVAPATLHVWAGFISHDKQQASWSVALGNLEGL